jgi:hypothetical protein
MPALNSMVYIRPFRINRVLYRKEKSAILDEIHQHYWVQKPEVRPAPSQQVGAGASAPLRERRGG